MVGLIVALVLGLTYLGGWYVTACVALQRRLQAPACPRTFKPQHDGGCITATDKRRYPTLYEDSRVCVRVPLGETRPRNAGDARYAAAVGLVWCVLMFPYLIERTAGRTTGELRREASEQKRLLAERRAEIARLEAEIEATRGGDDGR